MIEAIRTVQFKSLPIEIEVKDLKFVKELPKLMGNPHKATFYQIVWLTQGEAVFHIDFREVPVRANEVLIIAAGQVCRFDVDSGYRGKIILFTGSFFTVTELDSNFLYTSDVLNPDSLNKTIPVCPLFMNNLIHLLDEELKQPMDDFQPGKAQSFLRIILLETERQMKASHPVVVSSLVRRFYNAVEESFRENRNTEFYVKQLGVNEKVLSKEVKALTGNTPKVYIDKRTMLEAKRLLAYSALSAKEIGFELGFNEPTNFAKYFRKHTGMTPARFRDTAGKRG